MKTLLYIFIVSLFILLSVCLNRGISEAKFTGSIPDSLVSDSSLAYDTVKISDIVSNPLQYEGKLCVINGKYGGWSATPIKCDTENLGRISKSDYIIYDETGCIYVKGVLKYLYKEKELMPTDKECFGAKLTILAYVYLKEGKPVMTGNE